MKSKLTIAICAILTFSLVLSGCTVAAAPAANEGGNPAGNGYASNPAIYEDGVSARNGYANNTADALETGSGYRGGNGNAGAGTADNCDPVNGGSAAAYPDYAPDKADLALSLSGYGSDGALGDEQLTLADMLTYAVQDEYLARAEYDRILSENGTIRPFSNILRAEETHIDALLPLFDVYWHHRPRGRRRKPRRRCRQSDGGVSGRRQRGGEQHRDVRNIPGTGSARGCAHRV